MGILTVLGRVWRIGAYLLAVFLAALALGPLAPPRDQGQTESADPASLIVLTGEDGRLETRVLSLRGEPAAMGYQAGALLRDEIRQAVSVALAHCAAEQMSWRSCQARGEALRAWLTPAMRAEIRGIARGAQVSEIDLLLLNSLSDELFRASGGSHGATIAAWDRATVTGAALLGGVWDYDGAIAPLWMARQPTSGAATFLLGLPGWLGGLAGMNAGRLSAFCLPIGTADAALEGLPASIVLRVALANSTTPDEALTSSMLQRHAGGAQIWFAEGQTGVRGLEFTAHLQSRLPSDLGASMSAGLYAHPALSATQLSGADADGVDDAQARWQAMEAVIRANVGWIGPEKTLSILRDADGHGDGLLLLFDPTQGMLRFGRNSQESASLMTIRPMEFLDVMTD